MKKINILTILFILTCQNIQITTNPICNIFCCATVNTAIHPTKTANIKNITITPNNQRSQDAQNDAYVQALRLSTVINNEEFIKNRQYKYLEAITHNQIKKSGMFQYVHHLIFVPELLPEIYSVYEDCDDNLPNQIKLTQQRLRQRLQKKL